MQCCAGAEAQLNPEVHPLVIVVDLGQEPKRLICDIALIAQPGNGSENDFAVTERNAERLQVLAIEVQQRSEVDVMRNEGFGILAELIPSSHFRMSRAMSRPWTPRNLRNPPRPKLHGCLKTSVGEIAPPRGRHYECTTSVNEEAGTSHDNRR